jgi:hypothetical protein
MNYQEIKTWLTRRIRARSVQSLVGGFLTLLGGCVVLAATWGLCYLVSLVALGTWIGHHDWVHSVVGLIVIPVLFVGNARTSREYLSQYSVTTGTASDQVVHFYVPGVGMGSTVNPLAPDTIHTGVKMIADCLYVGPRIVVSAFRQFRKGLHLRRIDVEGCAAVIAVLQARGRKMSFQEVVNSIEGLDPATVFPHLQEIEGVVFLNAEPGSLTLTSELKQELIGAR